MQHGLRTTGAIRITRIGNAPSGTERPPSRLCQRQRKRFEAWCHERGFPSGPITIERRKSGEAFFPDR